MRAQRHMGAAVTILEPNDRELWKLVRRRVNQLPSIPMTQIAAELGVDIDDLCAWIMAYTEPKPKPQYLAGKTLASKGCSVVAADQRHQNWARAREAAAIARAAPPVAK